MEHRRPIPVTQAVGEGPVKRRDVLDGVLALIELPCYYHDAA